MDGSESEQFRAKNRRRGGTAAWNYCAARHTRRQRKVTTRLGWTRIPQKCHSNDWQLNVRSVRKSISDDSDRGFLIGRGKSMKANVMLFVQSDRVPLVWSKIAF